jgi:Uma2 family endonuclease
VSEYWIVDPEARTVEVLVHAAGAYERCGRFVEGDRIASSTLRSLDLTVADIMA